MGLTWLLAVALLAGAAGSLAPPAQAAGTISLTTLGSAYTQDFDTLSTAGTANTALPAGWDLSESGTSARNNGAYAASTGSDSAGDVYSFGGALAPERAYGTLLSGTLTPTIGANFTNTTGGAINTLALSYVGEQWRLGATDRADRIDFQFSLDATSLSTGTWTSADALDFSSPITAGLVGALDGNAAGNRTTVQATIQNLAIADGATFWIRWSDLNATGADDGLAVDEFSLTPSADVLVCGDPATAIHEIQGTGAASPLAGNVATIEGVVVGDYQAAGSFGGYFIQEEDGDADADAATSEGIFAFAGNFGPDVEAGDAVRVRGTVTEFNGLTELASLNAVEICDSGLSVTPAAVSLPVASLSDHERTEGMLVDLDQTLTAADVFSLGRFGEVSLSGGGRLFAPTAVTTPGAAAIAQLDLNNRSRIILDDGNGQQNIDPTRYPQGGLSASNTLRVGDSLPGLTGVMDFRFGNYRIQPVGPISFAHTNPRPAAPAPVGGNLKVASFNVQNYFNGNGSGLDGLPGGFPTPRGADTLFEFNRQRVKVISAILAIDADIVGLVDIENDPAGNSAIEDLVSGLNAVTGAGTYSFVDTGVIGGDAVRVALIYRPAAVTPVGGSQVITAAVDPRFDDTLNRPSLAQTFENDNGGRLTVVVNHLKSKGSACAGDPDTGDGQGDCNLTRKAAAQALVDWLATDPTGSGDPDVLLIGDMNAYTFEDPITTFTSGGFTNLVRQFGGLAAYSFAINGESGYLDHALASSSLASQATGTTDWHINADEPTVLDYNVEFKSPGQVTSFYEPGPYRASDHDPVIVGLSVCEQTPPTLSVAVSPSTLFPPNHMYRRVDATVAASDDSGLAPTVELLSVTSNEPDNAPGGADGNTTNDVVIVDQDTFRLRAERDENGTGRTYTITYRASDACGNTTTASATVMVPVRS